MAERVLFGDLWVGDRFNLGDNLWTKLGHDTARQHCKNSIALGSRGHGYIGDTICSFEKNDEVEFVHPGAEVAKTDLAATVYVGKDKLEICWHGQLPEGVHHLSRVIEVREGGKAKDGSND